MKDFSVKLIVRNNRLLCAVEDKFGTSAELSRVSGVNQSTIAAYMTMKQTPVGRDGWRQTALDVASALGVYADELWPEHLQDVRLKSSSATLALDAEEVAQIAQIGTIDSTEAKDMIVKMSKKLPPRLHDFLCWRVGDGANATLDECGEYLGVTRERARQIEIKMMREMRKQARRLGIEGIA